MDNTWLKPELIWFILGFILFLVEFSAPGFIFFFFGVGAWIVSLICLFADPGLNAQLLIFLASSVVLLVLLRRYMQNIFRGRTTDRASADEDEAVGSKATVISDITPERGGRISFRGSEWNAEAAEEITAGATVEITGRDNITFNVKKI